MPATSPNGVLTKYPHDCGVTVPVRSAGPLFTEPARICGYLWPGLIVGGGPHHGPTDAEQHTDDEPHTTDHEHTWRQPLYWRAVDEGRFPTFQDTFGVGSWVGRR